ncbi:MAG: thiamine ABC transporter ATP-binding protein [Shimia sp.]
MLRCDGLRVTFPGFILTADLEVEAGARVAVIGPSGGGKSTFLAALAGFVPHGGRVTWRGEDLSACPPGRRPITVLFQDQNLFPHLTLSENVALAFGATRRAARENADTVAEGLAQVGLDGFGARRPGEVSGGQRARAALARALLRDRDVLLLDEPFSALGPALKADMLDLVEEVTARTKATLLMVTHDPDDALRLCPTTLVVDEGRVDGPHDTAPLMDDPPEALRAYLGATRHAPRT